MQNNGNLVLYNKTTTFSNGIGNGGSIWSSGTNSSNSPFKAIV